MLIVCLSCHFGMGMLLYHGAGGTPLAVLDDTCILTMTRTYLGPKLSSMRFRYSYSRGMRFSTCDLSSIQLIFAITLTLTIQDAYDRGNESSKLISTILFGRFIKLVYLAYSAKSLSFTIMLSLHLLLYAPIKRAQLSFLVQCAQSQNYY